MLIWDVNNERKNKSCSPIKIAFGALISTRFANAIDHTQQFIPIINSSVVDVTVFQHQSPDEPDKPGKGYLLPKTNNKNLGDDAKTFFEQYKQYRNYKFKSVPSYITLSPQSSKDSKDSKEKPITNTFCSLILSGRKVTILDNKLPKPHSIKESDEGNFQTVYNTSDFFKANVRTKDWWKFYYNINRDDLTTKAMVQRYEIVCTNFADTNHKINVFGEYPVYLEHNFYGKGSQRTQSTLTGFKLQNIEYGKSATKSAQICWGLEDTGEDTGEKKNLCYEIESFTNGELKDCTVGTEKALIRFSSNTEEKSRYLLYNQKEDEDDKSRRGLVKTGVTNDSEFNPSDYETDEEEDEENDDLIKIEHVKFKMEAPHIFPRNKSHKTSMRVSCKDIIKNSKDKHIVVKDLKDQKQTVEIKCRPVHKEGSKYLFEEKPQYYVDGICEIKEITQNTDKLNTSKKRNKINKTTCKKDTKININFSPYIKTERAEQTTSKPTSATTETREHILNENMVVSQPEDGKKLEDFQTRKTIDCTTINNAPKGSSGKVTLVCTGGKKGGNASLTIESNTCMYDVPVVNSGAYSMRSKALTMLVVSGVAYLLAYF